MDNFEQIEKYIKPLYRKDTGRVIKELKAYAETLKKVEPKSENPYWYKFIDLYFIYPDGVIYNKHASPLNNLLPHIDHIKKLGCNAMHILPFLESPMIDRGFDISDFYRIRKGLGSIQDLKEIIKKANKENLRIFMDLVFNHVSDQHQWFKKAQEGDEKYRKYFYTVKEKPKFIRKFHKESAVWAEYDVHGKKEIVNIAFPEYAGEIPHWREGEDGYWYYHTYYPQQPDLNWFNPDVFLEVGKVLLYWSSFGFSFRLDAIPFVGKSIYKNPDQDNKKTHLITTALKTLSQTVNPECAFIVETYESLDTIMEYFGNSNNIEANLAYNFHLCTNVWASLVTRKNVYIWEKLDKEEKIPVHGEWINFLRNHDELSLSYLNDALTEEIKEALLKHGADFREGYGISGRTFSLIGFNEKRFLMAYFLLFSFPGGIVIPYGDEIGRKNIPMNKLTKNEKKDTRNINRGTIEASEFQNKEAKKFFDSFSDILHKRQQLRNYLNVWPTKIECPKEIYAARYTLGSSELVIVVNLSNKPESLDANLSKYQTLASVNNAHCTEKGVRLGPYAGLWLQK